MSETKPKSFHRYKPETTVILVDRFTEDVAHDFFIKWRERIDGRPAGSIAFAPEAK